MRTLITLIAFSFFLPAPASFAASPGDTWRDPVTGMEFVYIPGGKFLMRNEFETNTMPGHETNVRGFWIGRFEVTQEEWGKLFWLNPSKFEGERRPVESVDWHAAHEFIDKLNSKSRDRFRLPTEAEWEYAARGGTEGIHFWGPSDSVACEYANVFDQSSSKERPSHYCPPFACDDGYAFTAPVGSFKPNSFGLYDMIGNVDEWCLESYGDHHFRTKMKHIERFKNTKIIGHTRGGSWMNGPGQSKVTWASEHDLRDNFFDMGFRLVRIPHKQERR